MNKQSINIKEDVRNRLLDLCGLEYPSEACGVLLKKKDDGQDDKTVIIEDVIPVKNRALKENKGRYFCVDPLQLLKIEKETEKENYDIAGFYHSHPDHAAIPSEEDLEHMIPGMIYLIVSIEKNEEGFSGEIRKYKIPV